MYLDNKYTKWYYSIINKAKNRITVGYTETHHIIPSSLGGSNNKENLVILTAKEHFVCHLLLTRMTTGNARYKMNFALHMITNAKNIGEGRYVPNSRIYDLTRKLYKEALNRYWTVDRRKEHADKIRPTSLGRKLEESSKEKLKNKIWSEKALDNRLNNCLKAAEARKGSKWTEEKRQQMFNLYVEKNKHLFPQVFALSDAGTNIRQISLTLNISWDRIKYILDNRDILNKSI